MKTQHQRFKQRIEIERRVLQVVNQNLTPDFPLNGLTDLTISRWEGDILKQGIVSKRFPLIVSLIRKIALLSHSNNDISREVFSKEDLKLIKGLNINSLIDILEKEINYE